MSKEPDAIQNEFPFRKFLRRHADSPAIKWQQTLVLALIGFSATLGLALVAMKLRNVEWRAWTGRQAPSVIQAPANPAPGTLVEANPMLPSSVLSPQAFGRISGLSRPVLVEPPFEYIDVQSFRSNATTVVLADIDAPKRAAVCMGADKTLWPCGIMARVALFNVIRHKPVLCHAKLIGEAPALPANTIYGTCLLHNQDIAVELVRSGFARSAGFPSRDMQEAEQEAKAATRGLWNGNWNIVQLP